MSTILSPIVGLVKTKHHRLKPNSDPHNKTLFDVALFTFSLRNYRL